MQVGAAEVVPDRHEVESARSGNLVQAEKVAVKVTAPRDVGDQHRNVVDMGDWESHQPFFLVKNRSMSDFDSGVPARRRKASVSSLMPSCKGSKAPCRTTFNNSKAAGFMTSSRTSIVSPISAANSLLGKYSLGTGLALA